MVFTFFGACAWGEEQVHGSCDVEPRRFLFTGFQGDPIFFGKCNEIEVPGRHIGLRGFLYQIGGLRLALKWQRRWERLSLAGYKVGGTACLEGADVPGGDGHETLPGLNGGPGDVWSESKVFCTEQGISGKDGFGGNYIAGGTGDASGVQGVGEGLFIDERAAGGVYEERSGLHFPDGGFVDQAMGFGRKGAVEGNNIGFLKDLVDGCPFEREGCLGGA